MLPATLETAPRGNAGWSAYFEHFHGATTNAEVSGKWISLLTSTAGSDGSGKMTIHDYLASPSERRVVVHSSLQASTRVGLFKNEYIWFLKFDHTGKKITEIKEFLDSQATKDIRTWLAEAAP